MANSLVGKLVGIQHREFLCERVEVVAQGIVNGRKVVEVVRFGTPWIFYETDVIEVIDKPNLNPPSLSHLKIVGDSQ